MSRDTKITKNIIANLSLKHFLSLLKENQKKGIVPLLSSSPPNKLRKVIYLSSGGKFLKYADFLRAFTLKRGYVPIHPVVTLDYYLCSLIHNQDKAEIMKDCFSLMQRCDELWVFEENLPLMEGENKIDGYEPIHLFPEGVLTEIYFWLTYKPNLPIRFFTWKNVGIAKYDSNAIWSLIPNYKKNVTLPKDGEYPKRFGIIDLGSSTVKLTVCEVGVDRLPEILHKKAITVNLAERFFDNNELKETAKERTINAVIDCQKETLEYGVLDIKLIGTGILRKAKNLDSFLKEIKEKTSLPLEVVSDKDEAELVYKAVVDGFKGKKQNLIVINAGGGSTEIAFGKDLQMNSYYSLQLGISSLNEKFVNEYPISEGKYREMKKYVLQMLKDNVRNIKKSDFLIYTGGELDYMIITGFPLEKCDFSIAHPKMISLEQFMKHATKMRKMTQEELGAFMPSNPKWMNGAITSNTILETIAEFLKIKTIIPSNKNLNNGVLLTMLEAH